MIQVAVIALFGAIGAVARYVVSGWAYHALGKGFPYGTLAVNLIGCFLLGAIVHVNQTTELIPFAFRNGLTIGMLGAFTTFSTFGYESLQRLQSGELGIGVVNIAVNVIFGLLAVWMGMTVARMMYGGV